MDQPTASDALAALEALVGEWDVEAHGPDGQLWPGRGRSSIGWHPSGSHLVQHTTTTVPDAPDSVSIIGCDSASGTYVQLYSDERGVCRIYSMGMDEREWTLHRDGDPFPQRFVGSIVDDGDTIEGRWEKDDTGTGFTVDFSLTYRRVRPGKG